MPEVERVSSVTDQPGETAASFARLLANLNTRVVGQTALNTRLVIALLADGHLLVEGAPGLAKTTAIKSLANGLNTDFHRIQFTPDLLPADLTGTDIYRPQDGSFAFQAGPIFHNIVLADEINRAPAKVQSALLEAMGERQVTIGATSYRLPKLFLVMATQNPIEQEGTYPLPEAQLDRFLLYVRISYPALSDEARILEIARRQAEVGSTEDLPDLTPISEQLVFTARKEILRVHLAEDLERYLIEIVGATRHPAEWHPDLAEWIRFGASPRATIALDRCARAHAWLNGRDYVSPEDIQTIAPDVLRHRILLSFEAQADGISTDEVITQLLERVAVP